jgi:hypothetical protein
MGIPQPFVSPQGDSFLKCAFAPPDFAANDLAGVPDSYQGLSLTKKHKLVLPFTCTANTDVYILLLPTPGNAMWFGQVAAGTPILDSTVFTSVQYTDFATMFGNANTSANQVDKFRFVSNHIEVIPTVNQMTWSGSIQAFKTPITLYIREGGASTADLWSVTGLNGLNATNANQYTSPFTNGVYSAAYNANCDFAFQPILEGVISVPAVVSAGRDHGVLTAATAFTGFDNSFESLVIKITGVTANQTCIIKTWACVEYQPVAGGVLYEYASHSVHDELALELYRKIILNLPVGVGYEENDSFWHRVLSIISRVTGVTSLVPGPFGQISRGGNLISNALLPYTSA